MWIIPDRGGWTTQQQARELRGCGVAVARSRDFLDAGRLRPAPGRRTPLPPHTQPTTQLPPRGAQPTAPCVVGARRLAVARAAAQQRDAVAARLLRCPDMRHTTTRHCAPPRDAVGPTVAPPTHPPSRVAPPPRAEQHQPADVPAGVVELRATIRHRRRLA
eukprot:gene48483-15331_t